MNRQHGWTPEQLAGRGCGYAYDIPHTGEELPTCGGRPITLLSCGCGCGGLSPLCGQHTTEILNAEFGVTDRFSSPTDWPVGPEDLRQRSTLAAIEELRLANHALFAYHYAPDGAPIGGDDFAYLHDDLTALLHPTTEET